MSCSKHAQGVIFELWDTVDSKVFARVLFSKTSHMGSFVKIKSLLNGKIILLFIDAGKSCLNPDF